MSQLSIGIEIRKSDLQRDLASAKKMVSKFEKDQARSLGGEIRSQTAARHRGAKDAAKAQVAAANKAAKDEARAMAATQRAGERSRTAGAARIAKLDADIARRQIALREHFENKSHRGRLRRIQEATREQEKQTRTLAKQHTETVRRRAPGVSGRRVVGGALGTIGAGTRFAAGAAGIGGALILGASVEKQLGAQTAAADLANQAALAGDPRSREEIQRSVLDQAGTIGQDTGLGRESVIAGLRAFQEVAGDLQGAQTNIARFANIALASGTDLGDLGRAAGIFSQQLKANGLQGKELEDALDEVLRAGTSLSAQGSVEFKDVAKTAGRIAATSGRVGGGDPKQAIIDALALNQLAVLGGAASAEESATATQRMTDDLISNKDKFKSRLGVNVFGKDGGLRPIRELVLDIVNKSKGDITKLSGLFNDRGIKAVEFLGKIQRGDKSGLTGDDSKAGLAFLTGTTSQEQIASGAAFAKSQDSANIARAFEQLHMTVGKDLVPVIANQLIPALTQATPAIAGTTSAFGKLANWAGSDPFAALGVLAGAALTKSLGGEVVAQAAAGSLKTALTASIAAAGIGLVVVGAIRAAFEREENARSNSKVQKLLNEGDVVGAADESMGSLGKLAGEGFIDRGAKFLGALATGDLSSWLGGREDVLNKADKVSGALGEETAAVSAEADKYQAIADEIEARRIAERQAGDSAKKLAEELDAARRALGGGGSPGGRGGSGSPPTKPIGG